MSRIVAALVAVVCTLTLSAVVSPAEAAKPSGDRIGGWCC